MSEFDNPAILRSVLEDLQTGLYLLGRDGKIHFWSKGAERITGYRGQDVLGRFAHESLFAHGEENKTALADARSALSNVLRDGKPVTADVSLRHRDGHSIRVLLRAVPVRDADGAIIGVAESFDEPPSNSTWERRKTKLAGYHCLDEVTGTHNQALTCSHLRENLAMFAEHRIPVSILVIQIDQLEHFRSAYGPGALAVVLRAAAQSLEMSLRPTDFLGRYQENYFLAILPECDEPDLGRVVERLKKMVTYAEVRWWGDELSITASFGGATSLKDDTVESIIERGKQALAESVGAGAIATR